MKTNSGTIRSMIVILLMLTAAESRAQVSFDHWNVTVRAFTSTLMDSLGTFGIRSDATGDFDNAYDIPRPPRAPSGDYLELYFPHSGGNYPPVLGSKYATDFKGSTNPSWAFSVESSLPGVITIVWDSSYVNSIEGRVNLFLYDIATGTRVNMRRTGHYMFTYSTRRDFEILGAVTINLTYLMEGFWNGSTQVQDTIHGYLAGENFPHAFVDSSVVHLSSNGTGMLVFPLAPSGSYYLVVKHRNHLEVWSAAALALVNGTTTMASYNFSTSGSMAYGTNALQAVGSVYVAWGGDVNQDGVVDFLDRNLTWNDRSLTGYRSTDCNGDGITNGDDSAVVLANRLHVFQRP